MLFGWTSAWRKRREKRAAEAARKVRGRYHRPQFENLEDRNLLAVTLGPITTGANASSTFTVPSGKDLYVPLPASDIGQTITYTAGSSNSSVVATVMPSSNPTLTLDVTGGTGSATFSGAMTFELFGNLTPNTVSNIVNLVNNLEYTNNPAEFYRVLTGVPDQAIQGGILYSGSTASAPTSIADEFNSALTFNSPGMLAMANAGPNTGSSEFFITAPGVAQTSMPNSNWNFQYAIFGELTSGFDIYNDILNTPLTTNPQSGEDSDPVSTIHFTASVSSTTTQAGVVQITEPSDFTGSATITITATGSDSTTAEQTFTVNASPPVPAMVSNADPLILSSAATNNSTTLNTPVGTAVSLPIVAKAGFTGGTFTFSVLPASPTFADPPFTSSTGNPNVNVTVTPSGSGNTATVTLTPNSNFSGTINLIAQVDYTVSIGGNTVPMRNDLPFTLTVPSAPTVASSTGAKIGVAQAGNSTATVSVTYGDTAAATVNTASFGTGNITVFNGTTQAAVTGTSVSGNTVTYTVAAPGGTWGNSSQGTYTISVVAGSVTDSNGNSIAASMLSTPLVVDTVAPTVTISMASGQASPTTGSPILFTVNFSEAVTGFSASGLTLGGTAGGTLVATVTPVSGSNGQSYTVSVSGMANSGTVTATVNAGAAQDVTVGNQNTASNTASVTFTTAPTATLAAPLTPISAADAGNTTTTVEVIYGDSATGATPNTGSFGTGNITVTNGSTTATVTGTSVSGNTVTYTVAAPGGTWGASAQGTYTVSVVAGSVTDSNGNPIAASTLGTFAVGTVVPTATISPASPSTTATSASFTVVFSEAVTGFTSSGITLGGTASGTLVATVTPVANTNGEDYTVTVTGMTNSGTVTAMVKAGAAQDSAGNPNTASTTASVTFTEQFFNLVGSTLTITGTSFAQTLLIEFADATDFTAQIGGSSQTYSTTKVTTINFNGNGTAATFVFAAPGATMGTVSASLVPGGGEIKGPTYTIAISGAATNYFYGNSTSSVSLTDVSGGSNTFVANSSYAYEEPTNGGSYFNMAENFGTLSATAASGTTDTAYFVSAPGDTIVDTATYGSLAATGVFYSANNFPTVYAFGSATGGDTAWLYGTSTGFSAFVGTAAYAYMQGIQSGSSGNTNYFNSMIGFHTVQASIQSGGGGIATLNALGSNPEFAAGAGAATMVGGGIQDSVQGFQTINAQASGSSSIALVDGLASHGDSLIRNNGVPTLVGGIYTVQMTGFASVRSIKNVGTGAVPATAADFVLATIQNWSALANG